MNTNSTKKGFTLVELLIVIGILAVLGTTAVVILNPAELLAQARDGQRINDFGSINSALALYSADVESPSFGAGGDGKCTAAPVAENQPFADHTSAGACTVPSDANLRKVDGDGWVDVNLTAIATGSPLATLPVDPTNSDTYMYAYVGDNDNNTWELNARLESEKQRGKMEDDGGDSNTCSGDFTDTTCWYEVGTDPGLNLGQ